MEHEPSLTAPRPSLDVSGAAVAAELPEGAADQEEEDGGGDGGAGGGGGDDGSRKGGSEEDDRGEGGGSKGGGGEGGGGEGGAEGGCKSVRPLTSTSPRLRIRPAPGSRMVTKRPAVSQAMVKGPRSAGAVSFAHITAGDA